MNNRQKGKSNNSQSPWQAFLTKLQKDRSPLYEIFQNSLLEEREDRLTIIVLKEVEESANQQRGKLQAKLVKMYPQYRGKKIFVKVGDPVKKSVTATIQPSSSQKKTIISPLQALNHTLYQDNAQPALKQAAAAEKKCQALYTELTQRTKLLADDCIEARFIWRLRVGGMRGFDDLLLPVFHPVYGIPYVPSSSLKGAVRAWARQNAAGEVERLLGSLDGGMGCVQFLDAFPTQPCLTVDMANPQWSWQQNRVEYQPVPHALLSMENPELLVGLARTSRGNLEDIKTVKCWLEKALATGIGSRTSAGYGRTEVATNLPCSSSHNFQLWTQGMYGAFPPNKENNWQGEAEFRPTALRGVLRYWLRAVAFGLYSPAGCRALENELFGTIEPSAVEGKIRIGVNWEEEKGNRYRPHLYDGVIVLEAKEPVYLTLIEKVLQLASHLGGMGRGSRRPLHWNDPYPGLRGCYWQVESQVLSGKKQDWQGFLQEVKDAFAVVRPLGTPGQGNPGSPGNRQQDVLNRQARIYLVPCPALKHPQAVIDWQDEGTKIEVRGEALDLLYENRFKGVNQQGVGNANVGGQIGEPAGTPSYVIIQSNFPTSNTPYQAVTIFGTNQRDRATFCQELRKLGATAVFGNNTP